MMIDEKVEFFNFEHRKDYKELRNVTTLSFEKEKKAYHEFQRRQNANI